MINTIIKKAVMPLAFIGAMASSNVFAEESKKDDLAAIKETVTKSLQSAKPGITVSSIERSPIAGMYKATITNGPSVYITANGQYFIMGDVFQVSVGEIVNLTEREKDKDRAKAMAEIDKKDMIIFSPKGETKKAIYVFTDVDCGYCQKLHHQMAEYNKLGIEVRYLAYPRAGINSGSFKKVASAWCAENPREALTKLKNREQIPENVCEGNPIAEQFLIGQSIGLSGTPALITEEGQLIPGYVDPENLAKRLNM